MSTDSTANLLTLDIERTGDTATVRCHGKLAAGVTDIFYNNIRELIPDCKHIVLDLTELTRMDSTGLGALVRLYVSARSAGCTLRLINLGRQVRELLATVNLLAAFTILAERGIKLG